MIDWDKPLEAYDLGKRVIGDAPDRAVIPAFSVRIDEKYHRAANRIPVKFNVNLFSNASNGGVWYFTDDGVAIGGRDAGGADDSRFGIRNRVIQSQTVRG